MSHCRKLGPNNKDIVIFATKEDHQVPSKVKLPEIKPQPGLILENGDINWNCPCLGGMATGPCGVQFRNAFSCFHYSEADPKGSDCYELFKTMQSCMQSYPSLYNKDLGDEDDNTNSGGVEIEGLKGGVEVESLKGGVEVKTLEGESKKDNIIKK